MFTYCLLSRARFILLCMQSVHKKFEDSSTLFTAGSCTTSLKFFLKSNKNGIA